MKTVFKLGMKVYDQVFEPDIKGEILEVNMKLSPHPITVKFGSCVYYYTAEGCRGKHKIRTLSTSPYKIEGFEQKSPTPTYEEAVDWLEKNSKNRVIYADEAYINEEYENAFEALKKLTILRDYYNEGWQPDWTDESYKEILCFETDFHNKKGFKYRFYASKSQPRVLAFKNSEIRERFFKEQKELLEIAKPLL